MIIPRTRLLVYISLLMVPAAGLAGLIPEARPLLGLTIAVFVMVVLADMLTAANALHGLDLQTPGTVRFSDGRTGEIPVRIQNRGTKTRHLRLGLALPDAFKPNAECQLFNSAPSENIDVLAWRCTPTERGAFSLNTAYVETPTALGFWNSRGKFTLHTELQVYPNLATERRNAAAIFLNRGHIGMHTQRQLGQGREFEKLRTYLPGDNYEDIHWKATAKRGIPITKQYQIETTQQVYVVLDASRLSCRPPPADSTDNSAGEDRERSIFEKYLTTALLLGLVAQRQGDLFGLITFSDRIHHFMPAKNGRGHFNTCRDALYTLYPKLVNPDYDELFANIRLRIRRRALLIFLTGLDDPVLAASFTKGVRLISQQHLIYVNAVKARGLQPLFSDPAAVENVDDLYQQLAGHLQWQDAENLRKLLRQYNVRFQLIEHESLSPAMISQYVNVKQRQLL